MNEHVNTLHFFQQSVCTVRRPAEIQLSLCELPRRAYAYEPQHDRAAAYRCWGGGRPRDRHGRMRTTCAHATRAAPCARQLQQLLPLQLQPRRPLTPAVRYTLTSGRFSSSRCEVSHRHRGQAGRNELRSPMAAWRPRRPSRPPCRAAPPSRRSGWIRELLFLAAAAFV